MVVQIYVKFLTEILWISLACAKSNVTLLKVKNTVYLWLSWLTDAFIRR